ncbi:MAG TPA: multiheme c-type cytochrome [Planctomycetaceae bacterium]|nr:multiheme c-type cytochrome [Planctomycetaceae bacterium]
MTSRAIVNSAVVLVCLSALVAMGVMQGCTKPNPAPLGTGKGGAGQGENGGETKSVAAPPPRPVCDGWDKPALALILSGEQHGYIEPCGCSATQSGGLSRRADLFRQLDEKSWPVVGLDLGGSLKTARAQSIIKFETILAALKDLKYQAMAIGPEEIRIGPDNLIRLNVPEEVPFVSSNVVFYNEPELGTPVASRMFELGGKKVGVTAVLGTSYKDELLSKEAQEAEAADQPLKIFDPALPLRAAIDALKAEKPDLLVLLSHAKADATVELAKKFPEFDLVQCTGPEEPDDKPIQAGKPLIVTVGGKGKHVGVVGFYPDAKEKLKFELVDLDNVRFKNTPKMDEHMRTYQERLKEADLVETERPIAHPSGADFVGAAKCGECHTKAYNKWKTSNHANAYESLIVGRKGQEKTWIPRQYDPECLACHVTGWNPREVLRYQTGFESKEKTPHLMGQQCENCHGPGSQHVEQEEIWKKKRGAPSDEVLKWRKNLHLDLAVARDRTCNQCHDPDNSPKFDFDEYWKKVVHPWRD